MKRNALLPLLFVTTLGQFACEAKNDLQKAAESVKKQAEVQAEIAKAAKVAQEQAQAQGNNAMEAAQKAMEAATKAGEGKVVEPVDFRELKALLPETLAGLARKDAKGEKSGAMNLKVSLAEARYEGDKGSLRLKITDAAGMLGVSAMALAGWSMIEVDRETDDGFERTTKIDGQKAFEKWNGKSKRSEVRVIVGARFILELEGNKLEFDEVKKALGEVDLAKLAGMKDSGVPN